MKKLSCLLLFAVLFTACTPTATATPTPQVVSVYATSAAQPFQMDLFDCAASQSIPMKLADSPTSADIRLQIGEPPDTSLPAYQVGSDDILVVVHPQTGVGALTAEQVREIFTGQFSNWSEVGGNDVPITVWVFAPGEDIQQIFEQDVLNGQRITPQARLAADAQAMSDSVGTTPGSIGVLNRRWKAGNTSEALLVASIPVLAITSSEPVGIIENLLACLQK